MGYHISQCERVAKQDEVLLFLFTNMGQGGATAHFLIAEVKVDPSEMQIKSEVLCQLTPNRLF